MYIKKYISGQLHSADCVYVNGNYLFPLDTLPIPAEIQALDGYGWSAGSVYNEVDFVAKKFIKRVGRVDLGTLTWAYDASSGHERFKADEASFINTLNNTIAETIVPNLLSTQFIADTANNTYRHVNDNAVSIQQRAGLRVYCSQYTDATAFKTAMDGVMLYYELATPVETDISALLPDDLLIDAEGGGTLTFKQTDTELPVPNKETYFINLSESVGGA